MSQVEDLTIIEETDKKLTINSELDLSDLFKTLSENSDLYSINKELDIQDLFS